MQGWHDDVVPVLALVVIAAWIGSVAVLRGVLHARSTGGEASMRVADPVGSPQWWARVLGSLGFLALVAGPLLDLVGFPSLARLDTVPVHAIGLLVSIVGIGLTVVAQGAMGASWRGDVDPGVRTPLVTGGPFRWVRNPILAATQLTTAGVVLLVPTIVTVAGLGLVVLSHQVLVRLVEEPYLTRVHGDAYLDYASRTGRFVPGIGRLRRR
jgi:protein-S-isoprenylcysteine O-methyltransferase Ste14